MISGAITRSRLDNLLNVIPLIRDKNGKSLLIETARELIERLYPPSEGHPTLATALCSEQRREASRKLQRRLDGVDDPPERGQTIECDGRSWVIVDVMPRISRYAHHGQYVTNIGYTLGLVEKKSSDDG